MQILHIRYPLRKDENGTRSIYILRVRTRRIRQRFILCYLFIFKIRNTYIQNVIKPVRL